MGDINGQIGGAGTSAQERCVGTWLALEQYSDFIQTTEKHIV